LSRAVREQAEERGFLALAARGTELEREYAFGVVRQLLEATLRAASPESRSRLLEGAAVLATPALLPETALEGVEADATFGALHGLYWLCANLAETCPLLLVTDDVQWADEASGRFLRYVANRIETLAAVVLVTRRRPPDSADPVDQPTAERLVLRPLS